MAEFIYAYDLDGGERRTRPFVAGAAIARNLPVALAAGKILEAAGGAVAGIVGVVAATVALDGEVEVITNRRAVYKCEYMGTTKTSLTPADIGVSFDYDATNNKLNLDDTLGAWLTVVAYNNTGKYVWVVIADGVRGL